MAKKPLIIRFDQECFLASEFESAQIKKKGNTSYLVISLKSGKELEVSLEGIPEYYFEDLILNFCSMIDKHFSNTYICW